MFQMWITELIYKAVNKVKIGMVYLTNLSKNTFYNI